MDDEIAMLTTVDNPFDPFDDYQSWYAWDFNAGYHTPGALARVVDTSDEMSDLDQRIMINSAIDEIVRENYNGMYKKVTRKVSVT